jgi:hypothetical protein
MIRSVTPGYFAASATVLRAGRFVEADEPTQVAVVSESLARRMWPGESAATVVGHMYRQAGVTGPLITIVGVVPDVLPAGVDAESPPAIYRPYKQWASGPMTLIVRTAGEPTALAQAIRAEIHSLDPNLPIAAMRTMEEIVSSKVADRRFQMALTLLFALVALLLGAVGIYGVVSHAAACRTREIGLRLALGAGRADLLRSIFAAGMRPVVIGLGVGLAIAVALATALRGLLFGIAPTDPGSLGAVIVVLLVTSSVACYLPARRASRLDPAIALRQE